MYEDILFGQEQTSDHKSPYSIRRKTEHIYTRTTRPRVQFLEVQSECYLRIPVPLHDRTSSHRVYCQQKRQSHESDDRLPEALLDLYLSHSRVHL